jgi:hypothetical protein
VTLASLEEALDWLREVAQELGDVPTRLHDHAIGADLLGAPRMSSAFIGHLSDGPYTTRQAPREVSCPAEHPIRALGEPRCAMCQDTGYWMTSTDVYAHPLRAALSTLTRAHSRLRPHPRHVIDALLRERMDPAAAALRLPGWAPDDRRYLSAIRALYDGFSYTAIAPASRRSAA